MPLMSRQRPPLVRSASVPGPLEGRIRGGPVAAGAAVVGKEPGRVHPGPGVPIGTAMVFASPAVRRMNGQPGDTA